MDDTSTYNEEYGSDDYVVTYSIKDKSVLGWSIEKNGYQPDVYFKSDKLTIRELELDRSVLSKKILLLYDYVDNFWLIDLNSDRTSNDRFLKLKHHVRSLFGCAAIGFLSNGDLIQGLSSERKIYKYCFTDKPKNTVPWEYSQIIDIEIPESLNGQVELAIYRTKLFLNIVNNSKMFQFDLLTMNLERKYHEFTLYSEDQITVNKNQTLLAIGSGNDTISIYSMENGMLIYNLFAGGKSEYDRRIKFITLRITERLAICCQNYSKLVDPNQVYDEFDISDDFNNTTSVITKLNRRIFIDNGIICVTNGIEIDENKLQQLSNKTISRSSIYTLSTFKIIQSMLNEIIDQDEIKKSSLEAKINNHVLYKINLNEDGRLEIVTEKSFVCAPDSTFSIKLLNNQDLVVINVHGNMESPLVGKILQNEFDNSKHSIPFPTFIMDYRKCYGDIFPSFAIEEYFRRNRRDIVEDVINDYLVLKFGIEMLKIAIKERQKHAIQQIIESTQDYSENYMTIISLNLVELCDYYPDFIIKYISSTSIILSPYCIRIGNSKNPLLHSYTNIIYIKESNMDNNVFKPISANYEVVNFIVPFPQICVYQDDSKNNDHENNVAKKNHDIKSIIITILKKMIIGLKIIMMIPKSNSIWNEFLYKSKPILFCNIDTSTLEQKSISDFNFKLLFIISIIFGSTFLIFEIRQCLWNYKHYFKDIWNLFDVGAYFLPIIASIFWLINFNQPLLLTSISIILLSFKFLLFFRVFESFGIYLAIIIGVAKKVFPFLVVLFFIVLGYAQAFFIVLRSNSINDDNDPQNVATKYIFVNPNGTISNITTIIQEPDSNTNLFNWFPTSLLAIYNFLTGDSESLSSFTYREHSIMTILLVTFTFFTVIYLMNLFIGLLKLAIDNYNKKEEFLLQKAWIIMEIELFYMLPWQRNNKKWFPDWIYYDIPITEIRKLINAIDNEQTVFNYPPFISKKLRELVAFSDDNNKLEKKIDQLTKQNVKLKEELIKQNIELKEELLKQNVELKQQLERIINYIGVEQR
ncbi:hypothetical protein RhiirA4_477838 [Rhizophagus irregularis]|uniref:Ion transport domain-containing protein n=1 Tax=Rhizophagus irregularis TaxID=588596 RepID=A0A2I1HDS8_9GLOM|nr:hypothetical protein RhiirA4_477838 [Rhizophagus irregularis]